MSIMLNRNRGKLFANAGLMNADDVLQTESPTPKFLPEIHYK